MQFLARLPHAPRYIVAYSGGMDSHVLLHSLAQLREQLANVELRAVHVDHGLHASSPDWAAHCVSVCAQLGVMCEVRAVDARAPCGTSPEDAARVARYAAFTQVVQSGDVVFTAHHQDDQAETLLLQLLRGAGPRGSAGMGEMSRLGSGWLARPLLEFSRAALRDYALMQQLHWVDDPSNVDTRFDRNYLRQEIMPGLQRRWPAAHVTLARSAQHSAEAAELLEVLAESDLQAIRISPPNTLDESESVGGKGSGLIISKLLALSPARQRNVLRFWIEQAGLPPPHQRHLERLQSDVLHAAVDAEPCMHWPGAEIRRYRDVLVAMRPLPPFDASQQWAWNLEAPLTIAGIGTLTASPTQGAGLRADAGAVGVHIGFRQGGERIQPAGRACHATLKNLFQDAGVPPWRRAQVPLLYIDGALAAVVGYWYAEEFVAHAGAAAVAIEFQPE